MRPCDDDGVSEIVGFLLTFGIISGILIVAMIGFGSAQQRSYERVAEAQSDSIAQRVSGVLVDAAIFLEGTNCSTAARMSLLLEVPDTVAGYGFRIQLVDGNVTVSTRLADPQQASLFGAAKRATDPACSVLDARPRLCGAGSPYASASGGNLYVVFDGNGSNCLGVSNTPVP